MLDVHPPHEKAHSFADFLLHLLTITIGLFIALTLESGVEALHHRHLRQEADTNLRQELRDNHQQLTELMASQEKLQAKVVEILKAIEAREDKKAPNGLHDETSNFGVHTGALSDASWRTASATGALAYMEYDHVQAYADIYHSQEDFMHLQASVLGEFLEFESNVVDSSDISKISLAEAAAGKKDLRRALIDVIALRQRGAELVKSYDNVLNRQPD